MDKKLLIIGAGGHGKVVAEVATACGDDNVKFLDDNSPEAIGKIKDMASFIKKFPNAFVGIGNNQFRKEMITRLIETGYHIPVLIHPTAYVSKSASILKGTIVEPMAVINANVVVERGCIISVGAIVDHDAVLEECVHVNAGAIIKSGAHVEPNYKVEAGKIIQGY